MSQVNYSRNGVKRAREETSQLESVASVSPPLAPGPSTTTTDVGLNVRVWAALTERAFSAAWQRGCSGCCPCPRKPPSFSLRGSSADDTSRPDEGCMWDWHSEALPRSRTYLRNPWEERHRLLVSLLKTTVDGSIRKMEKEEKECDADTAEICVRAAIWDAYWAHFSLRAGPHIDALAAHLHAHERATTGGVLTKLSRRRVLVKVVENSHTAAATISHQDLLVYHARHFGAVEDVHLERGIHHVQFTTARAAQYFQRWIDRQPLCALRVCPQKHIADPFTTPEAVMAGDRDDDSHSPPITKAVLAPADESKVTSTLLLGPHVRLSTAHAMSLFVGMMDAVSVHYDRSMRGFVARFDTTNGAKTALHVLQFSLWKCFGVSLVMMESR